MQSPTIPGMIVQASHSTLSAALAAGATLVVASGRLGAVIRADFDRGQVAAGGQAWPAPALYSAHEWLERRVQLFPAALGTAELLLSGAQELALWTRCVQECAASLALPDVAPAALARLAQVAWEIQHGYAVAEPAPGLPTGSLEQRAYRAWARRFRERCDELRVIDQARLLLRLPPFNSAPDTFSVGFAGASPVLCRALPSPFPVQGTLRGARDYASYLEVQAEIAAAAQWALQISAENIHQVPVIAYADVTLVAPLESLLTQLAERQARASLWTPLNHRPALPRAPSRLAKTALQLLQTGDEISRANAVLLLNSPYIGNGDGTWGPRARAAAQILSSGVDGIAMSALAAVTRQFECAPFAAVWPALQALARERARRFDLKQWLARIESALSAAGWPGAALLNAAEEEELKRWRRALDEVATLDLVLPPQTLSQALQWLTQAVNRVGGAAAPVLNAIEILSLAEAAALAPAKVRVIGLHAGVWPAPLEVTPFLAFQAQRQAGVPAAVGNQTFALAAASFAALHGQATEFRASFAAHAGSVAQQAVQGLGQLLAMLPTDSRVVAPRAQALFEICEDHALPVQANEHIRGGAALLTDQAACPFRAFARHRLHSPAQETPQLGPDSRLRGDLVHRVLAEFWRRFGTQAAVRELDDAQRAAVLTEIVGGILDATAVPPAGWSLERMRLVRLCGEWLDCDLARPSFAVIACEAPRTLQLESLELRLRIDRIDRLADGSVLLIDYKTGGHPARSQWALPRPDQPQLLAYALSEAAASGIAFASVRSGHCKLIDWPKNVSQTAPETVPEDPATWSATRAAWQRELNALALQFVEGQASVAPKDELKTCRYCDLQVLCRVHEAALAIPEDDLDE